MKITYTKEKDEYVIKIYLSDTSKRTQNSIIKKIPEVLADIGEQKRVEKRVRTYFKNIHNDTLNILVDLTKEEKERYNEIDAEYKMILTTEKDAVRLTKFKDELKEIPLYVLPIRHQFLFNEGEQFNATLISFIRNFSFNPNK